MPAAAENSGLSSATIFALSSGAPPAGIALIPFVISMGEPGKEILSPVAICIVGGLITSTLLDFAVTPAVFRLFGKKAALQSLRLQAPATH